MKKITALSLIVIMLCLTASGKKDVEKPAAKAATPSEVYAKMEEQVTFPEPMVKLSDEDLLNTFGFETAGFDEYVYAICENILLAENIVLVKVKDEAVAEKVKQKLSEYVNDQTMMLVLCSRAGRHCEEERCRREGQFRLHDHVLEGFGA